MLLFQSRLQLLYIELAHTHECEHPESRESHSYITQLCHFHEPHQHENPEPRKPLGRRFQRAGDHRFGITSLLARHRQPQQLQAPVVQREPEGLVAKLPQNGTGQHGPSQDGGGGETEAEGQNHEGEIYPVAGKQRSHDEELQHEGTQAGNRIELTKEADEIALGVQRRRGDDLELVVDHRHHNRRADHQQSDGAKVRPERSTAVLHWRPSGRKRNRGSRQPGCHHRRGAQDQQKAAHQPEQCVRPVSPGQRL